tara:strand:+ start:2351 stop:2476 length:126 start_codon:yes stop_codon:yes gene_type:complete
MKKEYRGNISVSPKYMHDKRLGIPTILTHNLDVFFFISIFI